MENQIRFLGKPEVLRLTGMKQSTLYLRMKEGLFPRPVKIGPNSVRWPSNLVQEWMAKALSGNLYTHE